ncbi:hypothetical protein [Motilibacter aurantiacus]|uniref:hypothetical protein n=1 Tax=Motilibacter aurantiacus TaxID=2714955 RepID=UPI001407C8CF|nr:hypothetical protein [Motilibacter aurantiacus]NHC44083.1 hypothetical protein [Motilibacter aurantiacus]
MALLALGIGLLVWVAASAGGQRTAGCGRGGCAGWSGSVVVGCWWWSGAGGGRVLVAVLGAAIGLVKRPGLGVSGLRPEHRSRPDPHLF